MRTGLAIPPTLSSIKPLSLNRGDIVCNQYTILLGQFPEQTLKRPEKQRALRLYLGMVNYYHRFITHCVAKLTPFNNLLTEAN